MAGRTNTAAITQPASRRMSKKEEEARTGLALLRLLADDLGADEMERYKLEEIAEDFVPQLNTVGTLRFVEFARELRKTVRDYQETQRRRG